MRVKKRQSRYRHLWFSVWTQEPVMQAESDSLLTK